MHVRYPKTVAYNASNYFVDVKGVRYCEWYTIDDVWLEEEDNYSFFDETRRRTFSDVFHAKVLHPKGAGDVGYTSANNGMYIFAPGLQFSTGGDDRRVGWSSYLTCADGYKYGRVYARAWCPSGTNITVDISVYVGMYTHYRDGHPYIRRRIVDGYCEYRSDGTIRSVFYYPTSQQDRKEVEAIATATLASIPNVDDPVTRRKAAEDCSRNLWMIIPQMQGRLPEGSETWISRVSLLAHEKVSVNSGIFLLHEPDVLKYGYQDIFFGKGTEAYFRNLLIQRAFVDLVDNVPRMSDNNISNMLEIIGFIKALVIDKEIEMPKSLSDLWLGYRYQYTTTKLDAEEAIAFVRRSISLGDYKHLKCHGQSSIEYLGTEITCRAVATVSPKVLNTVRKIWRSLYTYGLTPSFYVIWDMIPYSFIVDWFLPIGNILAVWDTEREFKQMYDIADIQYSLSYTVPSKYGTIHCYSRWLASMPPELQGHYFFDNSTSKKTIIKRILDSASILIG